VLKRILLATAISLLSACGTTSVSLKYTAATPVAKYPTTAAPVIVGSFLDKRGEPSNWLGASRGGYGNPLKNIEAERPVAELVRTAFLDGLRARGAVIDQASGQNQITGIIKRLDCNQLVRREAYADIEIVVLDRSGAQRFVRSYTASNVDGSLLSLNTGVFASVDDLRVVLERTLREVVDKALDDSALRAALQM